MVGEEIIAVFASFFSIGFIFVLIFAAAILALIFWIFMLIDAAQRKFETEGEKIAWILIIVLVGIIGAIIYYFAVKARNRGIRK